MYLSRENTLLHSLQFLLKKKVTKGCKKYKETETLVHYWWEYQNGVAILENGMVSPQKIKTGISCSLKFHWWLLKLN